MTALEAEVGLSSGALDRPADTKRN
jgi:hypothetical protein